MEYAMCLRRDMRSAFAIRRDVRDGVAEDGSDDDDDDDDRPKAEWTAMETIARMRGRRTRILMVRGIYYSM
jgi:hypothetical protein